MNVTDLGDAESLKRLRQSRKSDLDVFGDRMAGFREEAIDRTRTN